MPGTFSGGGFSNKTTEAEVISGTIVVNVSGNVFDIRADCKCEGGKNLTVRYTGALKYDGPTGITTFEVNGITYPYASAGIYSTEWDEYYNAYITEIEILAANLTDDREFNCELAFFHSEATLAGTYTCKANEPLGSGLVYGELDVDLSESEFVGGILSEGRVTVGIEGDIYTIAFDGVKLFTETGLIDVTGAYTGTMQPVTDNE